LFGQPSEQLVSIEGEKENTGIKVERVPEEVMPKLTGKCVDWIAENKSTNFFLYFAPNAVHEPIVPTGDFKGSLFGKYGDFIHELDWSVGEILKTLDKYNLTENTLVIFTSDNGGVAQLQNPDAGAAMKAGLKINGILRGGKHEIWEGGFREPFIVRWPGKVPAGTTCDDVVSASDVLATLASILKTTVPSGNGEDSLDVSSSFFANGKPARESIVLQDASANYAVRQGDWKLIERENAPPVPARNAKGERKAKAKKAGPQQDELYNLADDPSEKNDVAAKHPNIVNRLRKILRETRDKSS
jgi:arylsulfatase A-like enzyme